MLFFLKNLEILLIFLGDLARIGEETEASLKKSLPFFPLSFLLIRGLN